MDEKTIKDRFSKLTIWERGGERAPHKPLLILYALGQIFHDRQRLIRYEEIDEKLRRLLEDFGPDRASYHPEYPFWRLQQDQIWEVSNASSITVTKSGDVKKRELLEKGITGGFPESVYQALRDDPQLFQEIVQELLDSNFPSSVHEDILQSVGIDFEAAKLPKKQKRDPEFREKILRAYEYKCAVCGFDVRLGHTPIALEAAHIKWKQAGGPDIEVNGLALCVLHHKLFDRGAFTLTENLEIMISDRAHGHTGFQEWLMRFHGKKITPPQKTIYLPDQDFRGWHIKEVFKGEFREFLSY
ncbi:restriction endonuclease [candidate division KSB3 bacterium]|nr:restriction endonuclease [candidate division KSB3 bacterium]